MRQDRISAHQEAGSAGLDAHEDHTRRYGTMDAQQMSLFPQDLAPQAGQVPQSVPLAAGDEVVDPGPVGCTSVRCRQAGEYLKGSYVLCEKHVRQSVYSEMAATKEAAKRHPHVLHCPDGFDTVRRGGREDHRPLGEWQRVQVCRRRECKAIFRVHWLWTGEPALCPRCSAAAFRELYPDGARG
jgi:hypothetical protein